MTLRKDLIWFGPCYSYSGYALHNRAMIFELSKLGWNIKLVPTEESPPEHLIGKDLLLSFVKKPFPDRAKTISINLVPPPALPYTSAYNILFTTLESKTVHKGFLRRCTMFDEVWVPCKSNIKSMRQAGWPRKRLLHCPEGVHSDFWNPSAPPLDKYKTNSFTFFYNGDWSYRKGIDLLIKAYSLAFLPTDNVRLLMLTHYQGNSGDKSRSVIIGELQDICNKNSIQRFPPIEFIYNHVPDPDMPNLYNCADVYVCPTRGEAWGLPIIQAMSCGKPAIVPNWGGQMDFCNSKISYLSKTEKFDTMQDKVNLTVDFYIDQLFCFTSVEHFASLMRFAYEHPDISKAKGELSRKHVQNNFSWEKSGQIASKRLEYIYATKFR